MKAAHILMLVCASFLSVSPAYAHGKKGHGEPASAAATAQPSQDAAILGAASADPEQSAGAAQESGGHDGAVGDHESESNTGFFGFLTKLHPATVHFPVALFLMAALTELFVMAGRGGLEPAIRVLIYGGAAGGVVAALFGWIHTGLWFGGDTVMQFHRWNGMLIAVLGLVLVALVRRPAPGRSLLRTGLFAMAAFILAQGFLGGELAHGENHLGLSWI